MSNRLLLLGALAAVATLLLLRIATRGAPEPAPRTSADAPRTDPPPTDPERSEIQEPARPLGAAGRSAVAAPDPEAEAGPAPGPSVSLRVVDDRGQAVPGAHVQVLGEDGELLGEHVAATDGRLSLPAPPGSGVLRLRAEAEGYFHGKHVLVRAPEVELVLRRAARLAGRVLDAGSRAPLPGATVALMHESCGLDCAPVVVAAGKGGAYELAGVPLGAPELFRVEAQGYPGLDARFEVRRGGEGGATHDFLLDPGSPVRGVVLDFTTGEPVVGAELVGGDLGTTDAEGRFAGRLAESVHDGKLRLEVQRPGYCRMVGTFPADELAARLPLEIRLPRSAPFEGTVVDAAGEPVAGADVAVCTDHAARRERLRRGEKAPEPFAQQGFEVLDEPATYNICVTARTDVEGRFRTPGVVPGRLDLRLDACAAGLRCETLVFESAGGPGAATEVDVVLRPLGDVGSIAGTFRVNGRPVPGRVNWTGATRRGFVNVGEDGAFRIEDAEVGEVDLQAYPSGTRAFVYRGSAFAVADVTPGGEARVDLAIDFPAATIAGRVVQADGSPVAGVDVYASLPRGGYFRAPSASDGGFRIEVSADEPAYEVRVAHGRETVSIPGVTPGAGGVELVVPVLGRIAYRVVDLETGRAVPGFEVSWRPAGEGGTFRVLRGLPDELGWYEAELPVGEIDLVAGAKARGYARASVPGVQVLAGPQPTPVEIALHPGLVLRLSIAADLGLPRRTVWLFDDLALASLTRWEAEQGRPWEGERLPRGLFELATARTVLFPGGQASVSHLAPGRYHLRFVPGDHVLEPDSVDVPADEPLVLRWRALE